RLRLETRKHGSGEHIYYPRYNAPKARSSACRHSFARQSFLNLFTRRDTNAPCEFLNDHSSFKASTMGMASTLLPFIDGLALKNEWMPSETRAAYLWSETLSRNTSVSESLVDSFTSVSGSSAETRRKCFSSL